LNPGESDILTYTYYSYEVDDLFKSNENYWLASQYIRCDIIFVQWGVFAVYGGTFPHRPLWGSNGRINEYKSALRPVVSLDSNVQLVKNADGTWNIV